MTPETGLLLLNEVVPHLRAAIPNNVKSIGCEDAQELIQDAICMAAKLYDNAEKAGKKLTPGNITYFTIQHARSGRRSYGTFSVDPLHPRCQIKNNAKVAAFEDPVATEEGSMEPILIGEVFSQDDEDPSVKPARKLDWETFLASISYRARMLIEGLSAGIGLNEIALRLKVSAGTVQNTKTQLTGQMREFFDTDILHEISCLPQWCNNLAAQREQQACRGLRSV